ncbi:Uncharacterised protein [Mycobacteroides abscessus subsp. abscessus]|nr:Uncharacterised protein [Mycobacteroides abscessus subsp. abscessus]
MDCSTSGSAPATPGRATSASAVSAATPVARTRALLISRRPCETCIGVSIRQNLLRHEFIDDPRHLTL